MATERLYIHRHNKKKKKKGKPTIDLFASRGNYKLKRFYSYCPDPLAAGIDAFSLIGGTK